MPPKARITKAMVVDAAFEIARCSGAANISARTVSGKLNCSTQPVMYHFKTIEDLKKATYQKADDFHSSYILNVRSENPMKDIGLNYIRFSIEEKNLFRFLFQSDVFSGNSIVDLINAKKIQPMLRILGQETDLDTEQAKKVFRSVFLCVHGYASMFANNELTCDEQVISSDLDLVFYGAISAIKGGLPT